MQILCHLYGTRRFIWNLPAMQGIRVQSLGEQYPLEKETATHSSILAWRVPWTEEPGGLLSMGLKRVTQLHIDETSYFFPKWIRGSEQLYLDIKIVTQVFSRAEIRSLYIK